MGPYHPKGQRQVDNEIFYSQTFQERISASRMNAVDDDEEEFEGRDIMNDDNCDKVV